jgi:nucleotide-binding universal stress UspA family protein
VFKRILFAHNGRPAAEKAMPYLEHLARTEQAEVLVLHVYRPPDKYTATGGYEKLMNTFEEIAQEVVDDAVEHLKDGGFDVRGLVQAGDPARMILEVASEEDAALILLGTRGPSNVKDVLLGDVTTEVLRYARCPVMVVP